jgi:hypothetical protein
MTKQSSPSLRVCEWLISAQTRFKNMYDAGIDANGYPAIQRAIKHLEETGQLTVGAVQYVFNRTHDAGSVKKYNTYKGYDKKYGNMLPCSIPDLIDSNLVDWSTGRTCMQPAFARAIARETNYSWTAGTLKKKHSQPIQGLFA